MMDLSHFVDPCKEKVCDDPEDLLDYLIKVYSSVNIDDSTENVAKL